MTSEIIRLPYSSPIAMLAFSSTIREPLKGSSMMTTRWSTSRHIGTVTVEVGELVVVEVVVKVRL
jgi:hypothetical protein